MRPGVVELQGTGTEGPLTHGGRAPMHPSAVLLSFGACCPQTSRPSSRSVTSAAIGLRSLRVNVTWAKSG